MKNKIEKTYGASKNIYDDVLTRANILSKLYIKLFWGVDDFVIAEEVLKNIPDNFDGLLLDVPAGTAVFTCETYKRLKESRIICLDYSSEMLEKARDRFENAGLAHVCCLRGDVGKLPFNRDCFDILLSMNGFHAFPEKEKAFSETARVLKKGGVFTGCFYVKGEKRTTDLVVSQVLARKGWFTPPFMTKSELKEKLESYYSFVDLESEKSIAWFRCVK